MVTPGLLKISFELLLLYRVAQTELFKNNGKNKRLRYFNETHVSYVGHK
jgi:hypothetical protein